MSENKSYGLMLRQTLFDARMKKVNKAMNKMLRRIKIRSKNRAKIGLGKCRFVDDDLENAGFVGDEKSNMIYLLKHKLEEMDIGMRATIRHSRYCTNPYTYDCNPLSCAYSGPITVRWRERRILLSDIKFDDEENEDLSLADE